MRLAKEHDVNPAGSLTRLATEPYVTAHAGATAITDPLADTDLAPLIDLWLEADKTVEADGVRVANWADAGAHGHNGVKVTANGATKTDNVINGHPVLRFAGAEGYDCGVVDLSARTDLELIVVGRMNTVANSVMLEHGTDNNADLAVHAGVSGGTIEFHTRGGAGDVGETVPYPGAIPYTFFGDSRFDKARTKFQSDLLYATAGSPQIVANGGVGINAGNLTSAHLYIGGRTGNGVLWTGDLALVALTRRITNRVLRARLLDWVSTKYGV